MESNIGDVAKALDLSPQAIRLYEEKGILRCRRSEESGYRVFDRENIIALLRSRLLRSYGFTMSDISAMLNDCEPEQVLERYRARQGQIAAKIEDLLLVNSFLRRLEEDTRRAVVLDGTCVPSSIPAHYRLPFMEGVLDKHTLDPGTIRAWNNFYPFRWDVTLLEPAALYSPEMRYRLAAIIEEPFLARLPPDARTGLRFHAEQKSISAWFSRERSNRIPLQTAMAFALRYVEEQGLTICGDTIVAPVLLLQRSSRKRVYFKASIPVE